MPPTTSFDFGDVVLVDFLFTSLTGTKRRPAVVVSSRQYNQRRLDVILVPVTSKLRSPLPFGETLITHWQKAGLLVPGATKPIPLTLEKTLVLRTLGRLEAADCTALEMTLRSVLSAA
jgi:mRNA interferase MazF